LHFRSCHLVSLYKRPAAISFLRRLSCSTARHCPRRWSAVLKWRLPSHPQWSLVLAAITSRCRLPQEHRATWAAQVAATVRPSPWLSP